MGAASVNIPDWYLNELAFAGPEHLDEAYVAAYNSLLVPAAAA